MHPTVNEQLAGVRRKLVEVGSDEGLSETSREALSGAVRLLARLEESWPKRLPFLNIDNIATADMLREITELVPDCDAELLDDVVPAVVMVDDEERAGTLNDQLRSQLARAVVSLPDTALGTEARRRIVAHLRWRVANDPAHVRRVHGRPVAAEKAVSS